MIRTGLIDVVTIGVVVLFLSTSGCKAAGPGKSPPRVDAEGPTVDHMLQWPLEGPAGSDRLAKNLEHSFQMKTLPSSQQSGDGPVTIEEGTVLSFAFIR